MKKNFNQWFWFTGGFAVGFTLIAMGHAALPKNTRTASQLSELRTTKVGTPEMEQDYNKLTNLESRYAESLDQQKKLKAAVVRSNVRRVRN